MDKLNVNKQCRSSSVGFFRSQLIWIYTNCRVHSDSAGQRLRQTDLTEWMCGQIRWFTRHTTQGTLCQTAAQLTFTNSAYDKLMVFFLLFPENRLRHFIKNVSRGDKLHEVSKTIFRKKTRKIFQNAFCWTFYPACLQLLVIIFTGTWWWWNALDD